MRNGLIILLLLLTAGCSLSGKNIVVALHDLGPVTLPREAGVTYSPLIRVSAPDWLTDTHIYYRQLFLVPTVLKTYTRDRWIAPPGELLERRFSLIKGGQGLVLRIQLVDFEQQFDAPDRARTLFGFNVKVFRGRGDKPLGQRFFSYQQENETANAAGTINSFAELSNRAADDLAIWLDTLTDPRSRAKTLDR